MNYWLFRLSGLLSLMFLLVLRPFPGSAQSTVTLNLIGRMWFPSNLNGCFSADTSGGSDVWGYAAPDGREYALMGVRDGLAVVAVPEMQLVDLVPGPTQQDCFYHRDIKTYRHYAYVVSEMRGTNEGLMIVDLSPLPDSVRFVRSYIHGQDIRSHNLSIDTTRGFAYILKQNYSGFRIVDLSDPENPVDVGQVLTPDIHDVYADHDTVFVAEGNAGSFSIYDVSDKTNPVLLARVQIPNAGYVHNIWANPQRTLAMTTEETTGKTVKLWDISDLSQITLLGEYLAPNQLAHNTHLKGGYAYISHYTYGVVVVDIHDPLNPVEVARYDTYPKNDDPAFRGCWGAYPFSPGGYLFASDIEGFLTVLQVNIVPTGIVEEPHPAPERFSLSQNFPNPFNPRTGVVLTVPAAGQVEVSVFNSTGQRIATLYSGRLPAGSHRFDWDGTDRRGQSQPSGIYLLRARWQGQQVVRKMLLLR